MADVRTNSLLLTGTRDYLEEAEELIATLDQEGDATVVFRALKIKLNSAPNIASLLQEMVDEALAQKDSKLKGTPIHIAADPISDSLFDRRGPGGHASDRTLGADPGSAERDWAYDTDRAAPPGCRRRRQQGGR